MMKSICLVLVVLVAVVHGGKVCTDISQCQPGECCQIMSEFMVVSKRDDVLTKLPELINPTRSGTCEPYKLEGSSCGMFNKMNGYCSCEPGTSCKGLEVPIATPDPTAKILSPRRLMAPKPGYKWQFTCTKTT